MCENGPERMSAIDFGYEKKGRRRGRECQEGGGKLGGGGVGGKGGGDLKKWVDLSKKIEV
jgi:hypothetical protein